MKYLQALFVSIIVSVVVPVLAQSDSVISFNIPSSGVVTAGLPIGYFKIQENNTVNVHVTYTFTTNTSNRYGSGSYQVGFESIRWFPATALNVSTSKVSFNDQNQKTVAVSLQSHRTTTESKTPAVGSRRTVDLVGYPLVDRNIIATGGAENNSIDKAEVFRFGLVSMFEDSKVVDLAIRISSNGDFTQASTVYVFDGSILLEAVSGNDGVAWFRDINLSIARQTMRSFTVKADIVRASKLPSVLEFRIDSDDMVLATKGTRAHGVASSGEIGVRNIGVITQVIGAPTIIKTSTYIPGSPTGVYRDTVTASYNVKVSAIGGDVIIPSQSEGQTFRFVLYRNGIVVE